MFADYSQMLQTCHPKQSRMIFAPNTCCAILQVRRFLDALRLLEMTAFLIISPEKKELFCLSNFHFFR